MGGTLHAIETGYIQREIQAAAYQYQKAVESGEQVVVGVNRFRTDSRSPSCLRMDPQLESAQVERLRHLRATRAPAAAAAALEALERAAASSGNLMPFILAAVEARCTVGEISAAMRRVFGEYRETVVL